MLKSVPPQSGEKLPENRGLFYLLAEMGSQLGDLLKNHPSLADDNKFRVLYQKVLDLYEGVEGGGENISDLKIDGNPKTVSEGYDHVLARLNERSDVSIRQIENLYDFIIRSLNEIIASRGKMISIQEKTPICLPAKFTQSFEQFQAGVEEKTSKEFFIEAIDAATDSIILGEHPGFDRIIQSMRDEVKENVNEMIEDALEKTDDAEIPDTPEANDEIYRLMTLTDEQLKVEQTWLDPAIKQIILEHREEVRDGFGYGQSPEDPNIRAEWTARITIKPRPTLTIMNGGKDDGSKTPRTFAVNSDKASDDGIIDRISVETAA